MWVVTMFSGYTVRGEIGNLVPDSAMRRDVGL